MANIRKMAETDAEAVLELWEECCVEIHSAGLSVKERDNVRALLQRYRRHHETFCLVAEEQDKLVGFVLAYLSHHPIHDDSNGVGEVEEFYVQPQPKRNGVGSELAKQLVSVMRERNISVIHAHGSMDSQASQDFWQDLGWHKDTVMFTWYGFQHES